MHEYKDPWTVGRWMTMNPITVKPDTLARQAFFTMRLEGFRHLPVVDGGRHLVGIVTDRDLRRPDMTPDPEGWHDFYNLDDEYLVQDVMTEDPETLETHDQVETALDYMIEAKFGALPVLDKNGELIGIVSVHDMLRAFALIMEEHGEWLRKR